MFLVCLCNFSVSNSPPICFHSQEESWSICHPIFVWTSFWTGPCPCQLEEGGSVVAVAAAAVEEVEELQEQVEVLLVLQGKQEEAREQWAKPALNPRGAAPLRVGLLPWSPPQWKYPLPGRCSSGSQELLQPSRTGRSGRGERPGGRSGERVPPQEIYLKHRLPSSAPPRSLFWTPEDTWNRATTLMPSRTLWYNTGTRGLCRNMRRGTGDRQQAQERQFPTTETVVHRADMLLFQSVFLSFTLFFLPSRHCCFHTFLSLTSHSSSE